MNPRSYLSKERSVKGLQEPIRSGRSQNARVTDTPSPSLRPLILNRSSTLPLLSFSSLSTWIWDSTFMLN